MRLDDLAPAPGKSCGSCTMCCTALEIPEFNKPAGPAVRALHRLRRLQDLREQAAGLPRLRMRMADRSHAAGDAAPRPGRHDPDGGRRHATNTAPSARRAAPTPGATRWSSPTWCGSPKPAAPWSPKPASTRGGFSLPANGGRPSEHGAYLLGASPIVEAVAASGNPSAATKRPPGGVRRAAMLWTALHHAQILANFRGRQDSGEVRRARSRETSGP